MTNSPLIQYPIQGLYPEQEMVNPYRYTSKTKRNECKVKSCKNPRRNGSCRCLEHCLNN